MRAASSLWHRRQQREDFARALAAGVSETAFNDLWLYDHGLLGVGGEPAQPKAASPVYVHKLRAVVAAPPPTDPPLAPSLQLGRATAGPPPAPSGAPPAQSVMPPPPPPPQGGQGVSPAAGRKNRPHEVNHRMRGPYTWRVELDCEWCDAPWESPWGAGSAPHTEALQAGWCKVAHKNWDRRRCQQCTIDKRESRIDGRDHATHRAERQAWRRAWHKSCEAAEMGESSSRAATGAPYDEAAEENQAARAAQHARSPPKNSNKFRPG